MVSKYLTTISTRFNPFTRSAKAARLFLARLPPDVRSTVKISTTLLPAHSREPATLVLTFKDGKVMDLKLDEVRLPQVLEEVERHERMLKRKEELSAS